MIKKKLLSKVNLQHKLQGHLEMRAKRDIAAPEAPGGGNGRSVLVREACLLFTRDGEAGGNIGVRTSLHRLGHEKWPREHVFDQNQVQVNTKLILV